jgi:phosphopantetheinyl transferase
VKLRRPLWEDEKCQAWLFEESGGRHSRARADQIRSEIAGLLGLRTDDFIVTYGRFDQPRVVVKREARLAVPSHALVDCSADVSISISHAHDCFALACSRKNRVGLDLSEIDEAFDYTGVVAEFFSPRESRYLNELSDTRLRRQEFFRLWSRKEAVVKCLGLGMQASLRDVDVLTEKAVLREFQWPLEKKHEIALISQSIIRSGSPLLQMSLALVFEGSADIESVLACIVK